HAFGNTIGFAVGWTDWLTYCAVSGYVSIGIAEFAAILFPALSAQSTAIAALVLIGLVALQWAGVQVSSRFQQIATAIKFLAFLAVVVAALAVPHPAVVGGAPSAAASVAGVVLALQAVVI